MFRCQTCRSLSESDEIPPDSCSAKTCNYSPIKIQTRHYAEFKNGKRIVACTQKPLKPGGIVVGIKAAVTCIKCIDSPGFLTENKEPPAEEKEDKQEKIEKIVVTPDKL